MIKNIINTLFTRGAIALVNFGILLLASRYLGSALWGEASELVLSITILQTVNEIYTGSALVYFIPRFSLKSIYLKGVVWTISVLFILNLGFYAFNIGNPRWCLHVWMLSIIISMNAFHSFILLGFQRIKSFNIIGFIQPLLLFILLFAQIILSKSYSMYTYLNSLYVSFGITLCFSSMALFRIFSDSKETKELALVDVLKNGFLNQLGNLAHTLSNRFNYYLLGTYALVGVYASSTSLIESIWIISGSISPVILTHIANRKDVPNNANITFLLSKICFLLSLSSVVVLIFLPLDFFTFLLGKDFSQTKTIMLYLSPGVLCISFSSIISHYFSGLGNQRVLFIANACGLLVTLISSAYFIKSFGSVGACYAASLSYLVQALVLTSVFVQKNQIPLSTFLSLKKDFKLLK